MAGESTIWSDIAIQVDPINIHLGWISISSFSGSFWWNLTGSEGTLPVSQYIYIYIYLTYIYIYIEHIYISNMWMLIEYR